MEEEIIVYPRYHNCGTLKSFKALESQCCKLLGFPDSESTLNYANPILDANGKNWIVVNREISSLFTEAEILAMSQFEDIKLPIKNI